MDRNQSAETKGRFGDRSGNRGILGASKRPGNDKSPDTVGGLYLCGSEIDMRSEPGWIRTIDTILKRDVLYHLSYGPIIRATQE